MNPFSSQNVNPPSTRLHLWIAFLPALLSGAIFPTVLPMPMVAPLLAVAVAVQLVPQAYPMGQHPPPSPVHVFQPLAHCPVSALATAVMPLPCGATTVAPWLSLTTVVLAVSGQLVTEQSRPV